MINNPIEEKSRAFAIRIVKLYQYLTTREKKKEFVMSKQVLRSGTSIGANVKEALRGQTKADFAHKMNIALKEESETEYWLDILHETNYLDDIEFKSIIQNCLELIKILTSIVKTSYRSK